MNKIAGSCPKFLNYRNLYTSLAKKILRFLPKQGVGLPLQEQAAHSAETAEYTYGITSCDHKKNNNEWDALLWHISNKLQAPFHFGELKRELHLLPNLGKKKKKILV